MVELYSQYASGTQFTAGAIVGSALGVSGLNPIVDRLNSISSADNLITGSLISGTSTNIYGAFTGSVNGANVLVKKISTEQIYHDNFGTSNFSNVIILDSTSGTNVDFVTTDNADVINYKSYIDACSNGSMFISLVYSGVDGNWYHPFYARYHTAGGDDSIICETFIYTPYTTPFITTIVYNEDGFTRTRIDSSIGLTNNAGSLFYNISGTNAFTGVLSVHGERTV